MVCLCNTKEGAASDLELRRPAGTAVFRVEKPNCLVFDIEAHLIKGRGEKRDSSCGLSNAFGKSQ
jgi:hypothetical protein